MIVITTNRLTRRFGDTVAVDELTLEVEQGEVFGLLGHNGAGKTTTVRLLNGVLTPNGGTVKVMGHSPIDEGLALRQKTGVLTETPSLYEQLNARDNLTIFADLYSIPKKEVKKRVTEMLTMFDLQDRADEKVGGYSKGMKQRLALARAFLHEPEMLFLDEPTAGLDPIAAKQVNDVILHLSREEHRTVLVATHNLHDAQRICDRVAVLEKGRIVAIGTPKELSSQTAHNLTLEIELDAEQVQQAIALLQTFSSLSELSHEKSVVTVSGMKHESIPDMLSKLIGGGVRVYRVVPQEPTLEDVYFALHSKTENIP
jgi:ABC-2 type transport system ATP-binding protein